MTTEIKITGSYQGTIFRAIETLNDFKSYGAWWPYESELLDEKTIATEIPELCTKIHLEKIEPEGQNFQLFGGYRSISIDSVNLGSLQFGFAHVLR